MANTKAMSYMKNVGKSIGYSMIDQIKESNPAITAFADSNSGVMKSAYTAISHLKSTATGLQSKVLDSQYGELGKYALDNIKEDLKSGKFYNMERKNLSTDSAASMMGGDFGDEFADFDLSDGSTDDFGSNPNESLESMIDTVGMKSSEAVSNTIVRTAEYTVNANSQLQRAIAGQQKAIYVNLHSGMSTINENISKLIEFSTGPATTHFENSKVFYESETSLSQERNSILKELLDTQKNAYNKQSSSTSSNVSMSSILDEHGMPDLETYMERIKQNLRGISSGTGEMVKEFMDSGILKSMLSSPLEALTNGIAKVIIPGALKSTMKSFNKTLGGVFSTAMAKMANSDSTNPVFNLIRNVFGIKDNVKKDIDVSKYEKGAVPFDGMTRKAIIEVIPTMLARIESALTKKSERRFDYDSGKFVNVDNIKGMFDRIESKEKDNANMDINYQFAKYMKTLNFGNDNRRKESLDKDIKKVLDDSFKNGILLNPKERKSAKSYGLEGEESEKNFEIIKKMIEALPREFVMGYSNNVDMAKNNINTTMQRKEAKGDDIANTLYNNSLEAVAMNPNQPNRPSPNNTTPNSNGPRPQPRQGGRNRSRRDRRASSNNSNSGSSDGDAAPPPGANSSGGRNARATANDLAHNLFRNQNTEQSETTDSNSNGPNDDAILFDDSDIQTMGESAAVAFKAANNDEETKRQLFSTVEGGNKFVNKAKSFMNRINELMHKPTDFLAGVIKKADTSVYNMIFGVEYDENGEQKSISAAIFDGLKEQFKDFRDWMKKTVFNPIKKWFNEEGTIGNKIKKKVQGVFTKAGESSFAQRMKAEGRSAADYVRGTVRGARDVVVNATENNTERASASDVLDALGGIGTVENAAAGMKKVSKTGVVAVSEGEMIVPPDMNPYNIDKREKKENKAKKKFASSLIENIIPGFAEGGEVTTESGIVLPGMIGERYIQDQQSAKAATVEDTASKATTETKEPKKAGAIEIANRWIRLYKRDPEKAKQQFEKMSKDKQDMIKVALNKHRVGEIAGNATNAVKETLKSGATSTVNSVMRGWKSGNEDGTAGEKDKDDTSKEMSKEQKEMVGSAFDQIKQYAPEVSMGALLGTGVSFLTGAIGGPLLGAAVGGGISLIKHSEKVQEMLFGKKDENGERKGNLLSKELSNNLQKYMPAIGKGATLGAITSLIPFIPGGPIAGIMVGSAAGFVSQNEEIKNRLFGEEGLLGKDFDKKVKKALPNMGLGAAVGMVAGPFGLATNLILGSAAGYATSTDKFKDLMFGKEDKNGNRHGGIVESAVKNMFKPIIDFTKNTAISLVDWAEEKIKKPLAMAIDPLKKQFQLIGEHIKGHIDKFFINKLGAPFDKFMKDRVFGPVSKIITKTMGMVLAPIKAVVSAPFKMVGAVGEHYRTKQVRDGNADYMSADQRLEYRETKGTSRFMNLNPRSNRFNQYDEALTGMGSEEAGDLASKIGFALDKEKQFGKSTNDAYDKFSTEVRNHGKLTAQQVDGIARRIKDAVNKGGDVDEAAAKAHKYVAGLKGLSDDEKRDIAKSIDEYLASIKESRTRKESFGENKSKLMDALKESSTFKEAGITDIKEEDLPKLLKYLEAEAKYKTVGEDGEVVDPTKVKGGSLPSLNEEQGKRHRETLDVISEINKNLSSLVHANTSDRVDNFNDLNEDFDDTLQNTTERREAKEQRKEQRKETRQRIVSGVADSDIVQAVDHALKGFFGDRKHEWQDQSQYTRTGSGIILPSGNSGGSPNNDSTDPSDSGIGSIQNAAAGMKRVDETGLIAVSKGEMIVPPDSNPFNINKRKEEEDEAKRRFADMIPGFAEGGIVGEGDSVDESDSNSIGNESLFDRIKEKAMNAKNKAKNIVYSFVNGKPIKHRRTEDGELIVDTSDADTVETLNEVEREKQEKKSIISKITDMPGHIFNGIKNAFSGEDGDDKNNKKGILGKLAGLFGGGKGGKGGLIAAGVASVIGIPLLVGLFKDKVLPILEPWLKPIEGAIGGLGTRVLDWFAGEGKSEGKGFPGLLQGAIDHWATGFEVLMTQIVPKAAEIIVSSLPAILKGIFKGVKGLFSMDLTNLSNAIRGIPSTDDFEDEQGDGGSEEIKINPISAVNTRSSVLMADTGAGTDWGTFGNSFALDGNPININSPKALTNVKKVQQPVTNVRSASAPYADPTQPAPVVPNSNISQQPANNATPANGEVPINPGMRSPMIPYANPTPPLNIPSPDKLQSSMIPYANGFPPMGSNGLPYTNSPKPIDDRYLNTNAYGNLNEATQQKITRQLNEASEDGNDEFEIQLADGSWKKMTLSQIISSDVPIQYIDENGAQQTVLGKDVLSNPIAMQSLGLDTRMSNDDRLEYTKTTASYQDRQTLNKGLGKMALDSFMRGRAPDFLNEAATKFVNHKGLLKLPAKAVGYTLKAANLGNNLLAKAGQKLLPSAVTGVSKQMAEETAEQAASRVARETTERTTREAAERTTREAAEEAAERTAAEAAERATREATERATREVTEEAVEQTAERTTREVTERAATETAEQVASRATREAAERVVEEGAGEVADRALREANENANKGIIKKVVDFTKKQLANFFGSDAVTGKISKVMKELSGKKGKEEATEAAAKMCAKLTAKLAQHLPEALAKAGGKVLTKISATIATAGLWKIAETIAGFIKGFNKVNNYIGVSDKVSEPNLLTRLMGGLIGAVNEFFTWGLFPITFVTDLIIESVKDVPVFKDILEGVVKDREESDKYWQKINDINDTTMTGAEINDAEKYGKKVDKIPDWYKDLLGTDDAINEEGELTRGEDGAVQKTGKNIKHFFFGNEETGEANVIDKIGNWFSGGDDKEEKKETKKEEKETKKEEKNDKLLTAVQNTGGLQNTALQGLGSIPPVNEDLSIGNELAIQQDLILGQNLLTENEKMLNDIKDGVEVATTELDKNIGNSLGTIDSKGNPIPITAVSNENTLEETATAALPGFTLLNDNSKLFWEDITSTADITYKSIKTNQPKAMEEMKKRISSITGIIDSKGNPIPFDQLSKNKKKLNKEQEVLAKPYTQLKTSAKTGFSKIKDIMDKQFDKFTKELPKSLDVLDENLGAILGFTDSKGKAIALTTANKKDWDKERTKLTGVWSGIASIAGSLYKTAESWFEKTPKTITAQNSKNTPTAGNSGLLSKFNGRGSDTIKDNKDPSFISQVDSKYASKRFNVVGDSEPQTIGDTGCGPASAAMVVNDAYQGNKLSMNSASKEALKYKVKDGGVNAAYFEDQFTKNGLSTEYIIDDNANKRSVDIANNLRNGNKVVLMGKDIANNSKENSPYGPNEHYVVATKMSDDGKYVWVNDPESKIPEMKYPASKVLGNTTMGVAGIAARGAGLANKILRKNGRGTGIINKIRRMHARGTYGPETIQYKVWTGLIGAGFNETTVAATMGNIQAECSFNPDAIEKGNGIGYGLVQWSKGRRVAFENFAASTGKPKSDLSVQMEYLLQELQPGSGIWTGADSRYGFGNLSRDDWANGTDLITATRAFMCCFERPSYDPSTNHIDERIKYANEYLQAFTGVAGIPLDGLSGATGEKKSTINTIMDTLNVFDDLAAAYGLKTKSADSSTSTGGTSSSLGAIGGTKEQQALVAKMKSVEGQLAYSMQQRDPNTGSGDCSSTVQWAYQNVLGVDPGGFTGAQETDEDTYTVTTNFDESQMQPGDEILYDGHVEMYAGNGQMIGHGGGPDGTTPGPTTKPLDDQGRFRMIRRWNGFKDIGAASAAGSGLLRKYNGRATGLDPSDTLEISDKVKGPINHSDKRGYLRKSRYNKTLNKDIDISASTYAAGTELDSFSESYKAPGRADNQPVNNDITVNATTKPIDNVSIYLNAILKLLSKEVQNTSMLSTVVTILTELVKISEEERIIQKSSSSDKTQKVNALESKRLSMLNILKSTGSNGTNDEISKLVAAAEKLASV